ncbi:hypothetical protein EG329_011996 [Mollisiaceae sp. DMI_Dod_QoI]|nr:hypothetical protein EG329_011996 [Helotiales sp. DMI_Dod_QoI]
MTSQHNTSRHAVAYKDAVAFIRENPSAFKRVYFHNNGEENKAWGDELLRFEARFPDGFPEQGDRESCRNYLAAYLFLNINGPDPDLHPLPRAVRRLREVLENVAPNDNQVDYQESEEVPLKDEVGLDTGEDREASDVEEVQEDEDVEKDTEDEKNTEDEKDTESEEDKELSDIEEQDEDADGPQHQQQIAHLAPAGSNNNTIGHPTGQVDLATFPRCQKCARRKRGCNRQRPCENCSSAEVCIPEPTSGPNCKRNKQGFSGHRTGIMVVTP